MSKTHRALVLSSFTEPISIQELPMPETTPGSAVVRVLGLQVVPYLRGILDNTLKYPLTPPIVPGATCIARIHALGPDATSLSAGQLVLVDITVRGRDNSTKVILQGIHGGITPEARRLMEGEWRHGVYAEYAKVPLENCFSLDENCLCGKLGYTIEDLCTISSFLVPFGGLSEIAIGAGDTVIVAPATGKFGGGAVTTALAMGARVIACGRNGKMLGEMKRLFGETGRIETVILTGDEAEDTKAMIAANMGMEVDAYIDFSPHAAVNSTHISSAMSALRFGARVSFMGGINGKVGINYIQLMMKSLRIQGKFMYERDMVVRFIKLLQKGNLRLGEKGCGWKTVGKFGIEEIAEAIDLAEKKAGWGSQVLLMP